MFQSSFTGVGAGTIPDIIVPHSQMLPGGAYDGALPHQSGGGTANCSEQTTAAKPTAIKQGVYGSQYHQSDLIGRLIGDMIEVTVLIDGFQIKAFVDSGTQMSTMPDSFAQQLGLPVQKLGKILNLEPMGDGQILTLGMKR